MRKIAIFTDDAGWHGAQLRRAFAERDCESRFLSLADCQFKLSQSTLPIMLPDFGGSLPDAAFVRGVPGGSLAEVVLYLDILHALAMLGVPVYNSGRAIERSVDKAMTSFLLVKAGLPTPPTWVLRDHGQALAIAEQELAAGHMLLSKPLFGSQGEGIRRMEKTTDLFWLAANQGVYYLQRFIECAGDGYADYRVLVINGRAVAAMRREGRFWLNNVARGARCQKVELSSDMAALAVAAVTALVMDYAGVDIIEDQKGQMTVIEINSIPAWKGLQSVYGLDIAGLLAEDLLNRVLALG